MKLLVVWFSPSTCYFVILGWTRLQWDWTKEATNGGVLRTQKLIFGFHENRRNHWLAEKLWTSLTTSLTNELVLILILSPLLPSLLLSLSFSDKVHEHLQCLSAEYGLVVRVPGYRSRSPWYDSQRYQIFWEVVGLERGSLSVVSKIEELLGRNSSGSGLENREYGRGDPLRWPSDTLYPQKLAPTSPTSCGRSVGIVRLRTKPT
jgi:hypothetical protein